MLSFIDSEFCLAYLRMHVWTAATALFLCILMATPGGVAGLSFVLVMSILCAEYGGAYEPRKGTQCELN